MGSLTTMFKNPTLAYWAKVPTYTSFASICDYKTKEEKIITNLIKSLFYETARNYIYLEYETELLSWSLFFHAW